MGVDVHVMLIDRRAYARLADVHRRWTEAGDSPAVLALLRDALARVRALAPAGPSRGERMREIGRRIDALPPDAAQEADRARFERSMQEARQHAAAGLTSGDPATVRRELEAASRAMFGAWLAPLQRNDARGTLLRELLSLGDDPPGPDAGHGAPLESCIARFSDPAATPEQRDRELPWGVLLRAWAFAWDREPRADVVVDLLLPFDGSDALQELVGLAKGGGLVGDDSAAFFTDAQVAAFRDALRQLPDPAPKLPERVARIRRLVELAASDPDLALATWSG